MRKKSNEFIEMKTNNLLVSFLVTIIIFAAACSKGSTAADDPHTNDFSDTTTPVVEINKPLDNQVFISGDTLKIEGKVTDNSLYRGSIRITNDATGAMVQEQLYEIHGLLLYNFAVNYKTIVPAVTNYTVTVKYEDHGLNEGSKTAK